MKKSSEKGFAQLLVVLLLVAGIGVGTYVAQKPTNFLPKAAELKKNIFAPGTPNPSVDPKPSQSPSGKKIPNPQPVSSKTASTKIVDLGYALLDSYINNLTTPTVQYPNGIFSFNLDNGSNVQIAPAGINGKTWRSITFNFNDNTLRTILLDGPVSGNPGTQNKQALLDAKNVLKGELDKSQMVVFSVNKDLSKVVKFSLNSGIDFQNFINLMQSSIITNPLSTEQPTSTGQEDSMLYCQTDSDCGCGTNTNTKQCAVGNIKYIYTTKQCPDFCSGIAGNLTLKCVSNKCIQVTRQ